jgi:hypothetical protein
MSNVKSSTGAIGLGILLIWVVQAQSRYDAALAAKLEADDQARP